MRFALPLILLVALPWCTPAVAEDRPLPSPDDPHVVGRIKVSEPGFYRIPGSFLARIQLMKGHGLHVRRGGVPVPMVTHGAKGDVVFLAHDVAASHSRSAVYELISGPARQIRRVEPDSENGAFQPVTSTRRSDRDQIFGPLAAAVEEDKSRDPAVNVRVYDGEDVPHWFFGKVPAGQSFTVPLHASGAAKGADQTLEVHAYGTRLGSVALSASYGGKELGTSAVERIDNAAGGAKFRWKVPAAAMPDGSGMLTLRDVSVDPPKPPRNDVSDGRGSIWVESISLAGEVEARIDEKLRVFDACPNDLHRFRVTNSETARRPLLCMVGPAGDHVPLWTAPWAPGDREGQLVVRFGNVDACCRLYASTKVTDATIERVTTLTNPLSYARLARHVIIAVPALIDECERLAAHRKSQGISSVVIPDNDIYMSFGHGEKTPGAIREFLIKRMRRGDVPLDYVLLAGDATYDRTDLVDIDTIPTVMSRTMYNGATPSDVLYVEPPADLDVPMPAIGRLPFRDAAPMKAYIDRLIRYETAPPNHASRRMMRFVTSEGRFGELIDARIERLFRNLISTELSPAFDIEITFASVASSFLWPPPEFNDKVIDALNEGALFYTYMGHGFALGFDALRAGRHRYPILTIKDVPRIDIKGTPPALLVVACTTAIFDLPHQDGVGEAIMKQPNGPVAYWGATRICHPAGNALLGRSIAQFMAKQEGELRLGQILAKAGTYTIRPKKDDIGFKSLRMIARMLAGLKTQEEMDRLALEGVWLYALLGDPALKIAFPRRTIELTSTFDETQLAIVVDAAAKLPNGTELHFTLEHSRSRNAHTPEPVSNVLDPAQFPTIRENHRRSNDWVIDRREAVVQDGAARVEFPLAGKTKGLVVKAWAITDDDVHHGAIVLPKRERP